MAKRTENSKMNKDLEVSQESKNISKKTKSLTKKSKSLTDAKISKKSKSLKTISVEKVTGIITIVWQAFEKEKPNTLRCYKKEGLRLYNKELGSWDKISRLEFKEMMSDFIKNSPNLAEILNHKQTNYNNVDRSQFWDQLFWDAHYVIGHDSEKMLKGKSLISFENVTLDLNTMTTHPHNQDLPAFVGINSHYKKIGPTEKTMNFLWQLASKNPVILHSLRVMIYLAITKEENSQVAFYIYGEAARGKSTLVKDF